MVEGKGIGMGKVFLLLSCVAHVLRPRVRVVFWLFFLGEFFFHLGESFVGSTLPSRFLVLIVFQVVRSVSVGDDDVIFG